MVLDRLGEDEPAFAQSTLVDFRERLIRADLDLRLLERTVELGPAVRMRLTRRSCPSRCGLLWTPVPWSEPGGSRTPSTCWGHAARKVVECAADLLGWSPDRVARESGIPLLLSSSIKRGLDIEWSNPEAKAGALNTLVEQLDSLDAWLRKRLPGALTEPPLKEHVDTLVQIRTQDLEPDPDGGGGGTRIREGVAPRTTGYRFRIRDMRHGRKSRTKLFNGIQATHRYRPGHRSDHRVRCDAGPTGPRRRPRPRSRLTSSDRDVPSGSCTSTAATSPAP